MDTKSLIVYCLGEYVKLLSPIKLFEYKKMHRIRLRIINETDKINSYMKSKVRRITLSDLGRYFTTY